MKSTVLDMRIIKRITDSLDTLNSHRPLKPSIIKKLRDQFSVEMTYHSNAIEGNRLTLKETMLILREGITVKGKNLNEHLEAKNHEEALNFLFQIVDSERKLTLSHQLIRQLHQLIVKDTQSHQAGIYRTTDVQILGSRHRPPPGYQVHDKMTGFIGSLNSMQKSYHPIEYAARAHHLFVSIHPFEDGNGRTGRLLMNLLLMRCGYPITIIQKNDRSKYYRALDLADSGDPKAIIKMIAQSVERTLNSYLNAISKSSGKSELAVLSQLAKKTSYSPKYLNLLVRKGLLKAQKEGRNWYSSLDAITDYEKNRLRKRK